jgi:hypothetical protein
MKAPAMRPAVPVTVSANTYRRLVNFALPGGAITGRDNGDGTVTFSIPAYIADALRMVDTDPERALHDLLGTPLN